MPFWLPLIGAGVGIAKNFLVDKPRYEAEKKLAAETQRYSPWTGLTANAPRQPSPFENALQGGMAGLQLAQGLKSAGGLASAGEDVSSSAPAMGGSGGRALSLGVNTDFGVSAPSMNSLNGAPTSMWSMLMKNSQSPSYNS